MNCEKKSFRKLVLGIFLVGLGEFEFLNTYDTQLRTLWDFNSQYSWAKYLFYK